MGPGMSTPEDLRTRNMDALVTALRRHGSLSRRELARLTGLSRTTVVSIVDELDRRGFIVERADDPEDGRRGRGRPAAVIRLHPSAGVAIGIFVGREDIRVALTDLSLTVLSQRYAEFPLDTPAETLLDLAMEMVAAALQEARVPEDDVIGAGLGLPSPIDPETGAVDPSILANWAGRPVSELLSARLGTHVTVDNDANLQALAELAMGAARGLRDVIYVSTSWGIGGALIVDGRLRRGSTGAAGELAHIQVREDGPVCRCGRRGCLGTVASGHKLVEAIEVLHGRHLHLDDLLRLAAEGDLGVQRVLADAGRQIGAVLSALCNVLNPAAVVVGGELGRPGSPLIDGVRDGIERGSLPEVAAVKLLPAALGDLGGVLGAAGLVVRSDDLPPIWRKKVI
jgi:predicted NBD/HSP70 family sugar kinase/biotin operon repressor